LQDLRGVRHASPVATTRTSTRADVVRTLPTYREAAELIEIHPSGITRTVARLGIVPQLWGGVEKHLRVVDVLRIAALVGLPRLGMATLGGSSRWFSLGIVTVAAF
jgi:hypothetical protein